MTNKMAQKTQTIKADIEKIDELGVIISCPAEEGNNADRN